jgi:uncharacterized membrane protein
MGELAKPGENRVAVAALVRLRRDVAFQLAEIEKTTERVRADLVHIDAVIRMLAPGLDIDELPERQRRPRRLEYFAHGEITRRILDLLRDNETIAAVDVARRALADKGLSFEDRPVRTEFCRRITMQFTHMARKRVVAKVGFGRGVRWRLAPTEPDLL